MTAGSLRAFHPFGLQQVEENLSVSVRSLIAGNWKMNGLSGTLDELDKLKRLVAQGPVPRADIAICPPATLLAAASQRLAGSGILTGGQDCHPDPAGAHTGDLAAPMLADAGADFVIVGHSERRIDHGETDGLVAAKARAGQAAGLVPIICVGETEDQRKAGQAGEVVSRQLAGSVPDGAAEGPGFVIAYEPVWAIGTGRTATTGDIAEMHGLIRRLLVERFGAAGAATRILYGGSMKPGNAAAILSTPDVNGGLVGGASLLSESLYAIISAA
jgi:triosephosphate isomerase